MAVSNLLGSEPISMNAGAAITKDRLVKISAANTVIATAAITDLALGAALHTAASGDNNVPIQVFGVAKLTAAAAISVGAEVMPDSGGGGKIATASGATARSVGVALEAAGADGDVISVLLLPCPKGPANS